MADRLFLAKDGKFRAISKRPSINLTPMGPASVPCAYPVVSDLGDALECVESVRFNGAPVYVHGQSKQAACKGDESGSDKGVSSGTVNGEVKPIKGSGTVFAGGKPIVRVGDPCTMQGGNTVGTYVASVAPGPPPPPSGPVPSRMPAVVPETEQEAAARARKDEPPPPAPPPPPPAPKAGLWERVEELFRKGMSHREFLFQAAVGMFKKAGNGALGGVLSHLQVWLAPLVEKLFRGRSRGVLEGLEAGPVQFRNAAQEYGASRLWGCTQGMVLGALCKEVPNLVKHPLLDWGPKLWRTARPLVPKQVIQKLDHLLAKAKGKLFGAPKVGAEPEVAAGPAPSIPNPGDGGLVLAREVYVAKGEPLTLADSLFQEGHGPLGPEGAEQVAAPQEAGGATTVSLGRGDLVPGNDPRVTGPEVYTAVKGDSAWAIAARRNPGADNETVNAYKNKLLAENPGLGNTNLRPGDRVRLPRAETWEDMARGRVLDREMASTNANKKAGTASKVVPPEWVDAGKKQALPGETNSRDGSRAKRPLAHPEPGIQAPKKPTRIGRLARGITKESASKESHDPKNGAISELGYGKFHLGITGIEASAGVAKTDQIGLDGPNGRFKFQAHGSEASLAIGSIPVEREKTTGPEKSEKTTTRTLKLNAKVSIFKAGIEIRLGKRIYTVGITAGGGIKLGKDKMEIGGLVYIESERIKKGKI